MIGSVAVFSNAARWFARLDLIDSLSTLAGVTVIATAPHSHDILTALVTRRGLRRDDAAPRASLGTEN
jgi:hypothetical protein